MLHTQQFSACLSTATPAWELSVPAAALKGCLLHFLSVVLLYLKPANPVMNLSSLLLEMAVMQQHLPAAHQFLVSKAAFAKQSCLFWN